MNVDLAARIIAGAEHGRLLLTLGEATELLDYLADHPNAAIVRDGNTTPIVDIPVIVLDPDDLDITPDPDPWARQILASWCEGLIDADDADRLLRKAPPT